MAYSAPVCEIGAEVAHGGRRSIGRAKVIEKVPSARAFLLRRQIHLEGEELHDDANASLLADEHLLVVWNLPKIAFSAQKPCEDAWKRSLSWK